MKKIRRKIIEIDENLCDGCGLCVPSCAEGALKVVDGKVRLVMDKYCDGLGACLGECPKGALRIVEREAEDFDEEAVTAHLTSMAGEPKLEEAHHVHQGMGCPSAMVHRFQPTGVSAKTDTAVNSALSHWPVQIRLIPPFAPFLNNSHLLIVADCVPFAYADFHRDFIQDKVVMVGCPKFDDTQAYLNKFIEIFRTVPIRSVTTAIMEVPCCAGLQDIVKKAIAASGKDILHNEAIISIRGRIL